MVNTFIISTDILQSFKLLDSRRLGKQRVEAYQILNLLEDAIFISTTMEWELQPQGFTLEKDIEREEWFKNTFKKYKSLSILLERNGRIIKGGWHNHPAVLMWIGYEEGLKDYINKCISEWKDRGFKNTMKEYEIDEYVYPWWSKNMTYINSNISALLRKEFIRKEKKWYSTMREGIPNESYNKGYLWISGLKLEQRKVLFERSEILHTEYCFEQLNDFHLRI